MPEINIPFPGLYCSWLSGEIDHCEESEIEHIYEVQAESWPSPLHLSESDIAEIWWRAMNYSVAHEHMARAYLESFDAWAGEALGETRPAWRSRYDYETHITTRERYRADSCGMTWSLMTSPHEYNFETDRLFVNVSMAFIKRLWRMSRDDSHDTLARVIKDRFTSYDGFMSHYSNRLTDWTDKPLKEWDHNELGTLLIACLDLSNADDESLMWDTLEGEAGYNAVSEGMMWDQLESDMTEKRAELLAEWLESDPTSASTWRAANPDTCAALVSADPSLFDGCEWVEGDDCGSFYRCTETKDMFDNV